MNRLKLVGVTKKYGTVLALDNFHLSVPEGELLVLLGPSGCCKSTILRMIAGLTMPSSGDIRVDGIRINDIPTRYRDVSMVFDHYSLYPHMTVEENIHYALKVRGVSLAQRSKLVQYIAKMFLVEDCLYCKPAEISLSQRQCVAWARSLICRPRIMLCDEPTRCLDMHIRSTIFSRIKELVRKFGITTIYVTHDLVEAMQLGDRLCIINASHCQQIAAPSEVYDRPANIYVASFISELPMNFVEGFIDGFGFSNESREFVLQAKLPYRYGPAILGIRPEDITIADPEQSSLRGTILACTNIGEYRLLSLDIRGEHMLTKCTQTIGTGKQISVRLKKLHFFSPDGSAMAPSLLTGNMA